ncbi:MAG: hypothetical protein WAK29_06755, partial [Terriglobales bacterium]
KPPSYRSTVARIECGILLMVQERVVEIADGHTMESCTPSRKKFVTGLAPVCAAGVCEEFS